MKQAPTSSPLPGPAPDVRNSTDAAAREHADEISRRFAWARAQGHAAYLWPDVPPTAWRACLHEIERVTACVLAGEARVELVLADDTDAAALGIAAFTSGMGPLLGFWQEDAAIVVPDEVRPILSLHLKHGRVRNAKMAAELSRTLDVLAGAGITAVVLKASHTSLDYFPEPGTRPAADIDIVVDAVRMDAASDALRAAGYVALKTGRRPRKTDWLPPGQRAELRSIDYTHEDNPFTIELHAGADRAFYGVRMFRLGALDERNTRPAPSIHPAARVLVQPWLTAFLAAHASEELHQLQLVRLVELVFVMRADRAAGQFEAAELTALLEWLGGTRFVVPALTLVERLAPGTLGPELRARLDQATTARMRRVLDGIGPGTAQRLEGLALDERLLWADGPLEMARRLLHMLWPTRGENRPLRHVYGDRLASLRRGRISLRGPR